MRYHRHLPLFLRVMSIVSLLLIFTIFATLAVKLTSIVFAYPHLSHPEDLRLMILGQNFALISITISGVIHRYAVRFRVPDATPYPLDTWRLQAQAMVWPSLLPLCAVVLALLISPEHMLFGLVFAITLAAYVSALARNTTALR